MRIANQILNYLESIKIEHIYGIPSGTVSPLFDAFNDVNIKPIIGKNEAGSSFMAARYASVTSKLAVCIGAGGPGICNMVTGIAEGYRMKVPMLIISGYINRWQIGKGAIQELNAEDILKPITKYSKTILSEDEVLKELEKAVEMAYTVPMGPVHLSIPLDILLLDMPVEQDLKKFEKSIFIKDITQENNNKLSIQKACTILDNHENGVIMVGKGGKGKHDLIIELSKHLNWPIITTPQGKGVISSEYELNYGNYGFASTDAATDYVNDNTTKAILVLGTTLGENATCNFSKALFQGKESIHIDWDPRELNKVYQTDVTIVDDMEVVLKEFLVKTKKKEGSRVRPELNRPTSYTNTGVSLKEFLDKLPNYMPRDTYYLCDMGEFMNFAYKYLNVPKEGDFETNLNYAAMGHSIGGAIGVQVAHPHRTVACIAGDGCFFMNGNEVLTAKEYNAPIIYIIINNAMLGFVEHGHKFLFNRVVDGFVQNRVDIASTLNVCGIPSIQVADIKDMEKIEDFLSSTSGPKVIEVITDGSEPSPNGDRLKSLANSTDSK